MARPQPETVAPADSCWPGRRRAWGMGSCQEIEPRSVFVARLTRFRRHRAGRPKASAGPNRRGRCGPGVEPVGCCGSATFPMDPRRLRRCPDDEHPGAAGDRLAPQPHCRRRRARAGGRLPAAGRPRPEIRAGTKRLWVPYEAALVASGREQATDTWLRTQMARGTGPADHPLALSPRARQKRWDGRILPSLVGCKTVRLGLRRGIRPRGPHLIVADRSQPDRQHSPADRRGLYGDPRRS